MNPPRTNTPKQRPVSSVSAIALLTLAAGLWAAAPADGAIIAPGWPTDAQWHPVTVGGSVYVDPLYEGLGSDRYATPPEPEQMDLVGGIDHHGAGPFATGYWFRDSNNLMFRLRVDNDPDQGVNGAQNVWLAFLNTDADPEVDWVLSLDNKTDAQVELVAALSGGPNSGTPWDPVVLAGVPHTGVGPLSSWSRFVNAHDVDGSHFHDPGPVDDDFFVDFAFPLDTFYALTGLTGDDTFGVAFATSTDHININKDLPDIDGWSDPVPEPTTLALLAVGGVGAVSWLGVRKSRKTIH